MIHQILSRYAVASRRQVLKIVASRSLCQVYNFSLKSLSKTELYYVFIAIKKVTISRSRKLNFRSRYYEKAYVAISYTLRTPYFYYTLRFSSAKFTPKILLRLSYCIQKISAKSAERNNLRAIFEDISCKNC